MTGTPVARSTWAFHSVTTAKLAEGSVRAGKLPTLTTHTNKVAVPAGGQALALSGCGSGEVLIDTGYIWSAGNSPGLYVADDVHLLNATDLEATNENGAVREIEAIAYCMPG